MAVVLVLGFSALYAANAPAVFAASGLYMGRGHTAEEIAAKWAELKPVSSGSPYLTQPVTAAPYAPGSLTANTLQNGLNMTNFARYLAGLNYNITLDGTYNQQGQTGALVMASGGGFTHWPTQPVGMDQATYQTGYNACGASNIAWRSDAWGGADTALASTVQMYLDDSDTGNISVLGHRRWVLNPKMGKTGFGLVGGYSAMLAHDSSGGGSANYVAWPSAGYFPIEMFKNPSVSLGQAWSISLNSGVYGKSYASGAVVTLLNKATGETTVFQNGMGVNTAGKYFNVETNGYGMDYCIIFRPDNSTVKIGDEFSVTVSGLKSPAGAAMPDISYDTCFISAENINYVAADYNITVTVNKPVVTGLSDNISFTVTARGPDGNPINGLDVRIFYPSGGGSYYNGGKTGVAILSYGTDTSAYYRIVVLGATVGNYVFQDKEVMYYIYNGVKVTGLTLDKNSLSLPAGEAYTLTPTVSPSNAALKDIRWSSGNPAVATVDQSGRVTAVAAGVTTITAVTVDGNKIASCAVTVTKPRLKGDVNNDGSVNSTDIVALNQAVLGITALQAADFAYADMDGSGSLSSLDLVALRQKILGIA